MKNFLVGFFIGGIIGIAIAYFYIRPIEVTYCPDAKEYKGQKTYSAPAKVPEAAATTLPCKDLLTDYLSPGFRSDQVQLLQLFLTENENIAIPAGPTGYYGAQTSAAVSEFQLKYSAEILVPVGLAVPTGKVGPATLAEINALHCLP